MPRKIIADGKTIVVPDDATDDEINQIVGPAPTPQAQPQPQPKQGFFSSAMDSSGLTGLKDAALHPINTARTLMGAYMGDPLNPILQHFGQSISDTTDGEKQAFSDLGKNGLTLNTRREFVNPLPIVGPVMNKAESQSDQGNYPGAMGTMLGFGGSLAIPDGISEMRGLLPSADALKLGAARVLAPGSAGEILSRALKPGVRYGADTASMFSDTLPSILDANPNVASVSDYAQASDAAKDNVFAQHNNIIAPYRKPMTLDPLSGDPTEAAGPFRPSAISGKPIAKAQMDSIPYMSRIEQPGTNTWNSWSGGMDNTGGIVGKTQNLASKYEKDFSVPELDTLRENANAKLNDFYGKSGGDKNAALSNPETARVKAVGDATRQQLYPTLDANAGLPPGTVEANQQMYGKLSDVSDIANKRDTVFARQDPVSLAEKIGASHGGPLATAFNFAKERALRGITDSDALVKSAIDRYHNPDGTPILGTIAPSSGPSLQNSLFFAPRKVGK
jgi:hypothetical protein